LYYLTLSELAHGAGLGQAQLSGWRFPVELAGELVGVLDVGLDDQHREATRASYVEPGPETRIAEKLATVEEPDSAEPRLLVVPALHTSALWVHEAYPGVDDERVYPLPETFEGGEELKAVPAEAFIEQLRQEAREQLETKREAADHDEWDDFAP
jgi:hypothetical protein